MKIVITLLLSSLILMSCASHKPYDMTEYGDESEYTKIALDEDGLTQEEIEVISSTKPPTELPIDISIIIMKNGSIDPVIEKYIKYSVMKELSSSSEIKRVTLIPKYLLPDKISFSAIQELGVRSLSEYVLVIYLDTKEIFKWTRVIESKYEVSSSIDFIFVDSITSAMLTSDKLYSEGDYLDKIYKPENQRKAQKIIFSEQAILLSKKINSLLVDNN